MKKILRGGKEDLWTVSILYFVHIFCLIFKAMPGAEVCKPISLTKFVDTIVHA